MDVLSPAPPRGTAAQVFGVALGLGLTSFDGSIAHIGYFQRADVRRRQWLGAEEFAGPMALAGLHGLQLAAVVAAAL